MLGKIFDTRQKYKTLATFSISRRLEKWTCGAGYNPGVTLSLDPGLEAELTCLNVVSGERCLSLVINVWSTNN